MTRQHFLRSPLPWLIALIPTAIVSIGIALMLVGCASGAQQRPEDAMSPKARQIYDESPTRMCAFMHEGVLHMIEIKTLACKGYQPI